MNKLIFKFFHASSLFLLLILVTILSSCSGTTGRVVQIPSEAEKSPEAYFCPKDNCGKILEGVLKSANLSVYCAFYDLDLKNIISALVNKSRIIDVKLVTDNSNSGQLKGQNTREDDKRQLMHNKFCIIDKKLVATGSFNPTFNDNNKNNNNLVLIHSKNLATNYIDEFDELWGGKFGEGKKTKNPIMYINNFKVESFFCPEDNCAGKIIEQIKGAKSSVYFMTFAFTNEDIADALLLKEDVEIRGIFDSGQSSNKFSQYNRLKEFGLDVKKDKNKHKMHHKVFIIDNQTVITGSFNPTKSGDEKNDENILIVHDKNFTEPFLREFDSLWH